MNISIILVILLVGVVATYLSGDKLASKIALLFSLLTAVFAGTLYFTYNGVVDFSLPWVSNPAISFALKLDGLSLVMILMNAILVPIGILATQPYKVKNEKTLYSLILFMSFAMTGVFLSSDALVYYIFWELSLIPIYFIVVLWGNGDKSDRRKSAMTFFMYTFAGSLFMLASIIYLYTKTGSFLLQDFYNANLSHTEQIWVFLGFMIAYAIKIPIFPFHSWQAGVYQKAPMIGTILLAGLMSKMGLYSVIRWQLPVAPEAAKELQTVILVLTIIGIIYGSIIALRQDNIKRFFAFASLAHVGFIVAGAYSLTFDGLQGAVLLTVAHSFGVAGLFYAAEILFNRTSTPLISKMGGIRNHAPTFTAMFFLVILASITIPLSLNFLGELAIMFGLYQVSIWYTVFIGTTMFLGAFYMLRMYQQVMLGEPKKQVFADLTLREGVVFGLIIAVLLFFGIYPKPITELVTPSLENILMYINK